MRAIIRVEAPSLGTEYNFSLVTEPVTLELLVDLVGGLKTEWWTDQDGTPTRKVSEHAYLPSKNPASDLLKWLENFWNTAKPGDVLKVVKNNKLAIAYVIVTESNCSKCGSSEGVKRWHQMNLCPSCVESITDDMVTYLGATPPAGDIIGYHIHMRTEAGKEWYDD